MAVRHARVRSQRIRQINLCEVSLGIEARAHDKNPYEKPADAKGDEINQKLKDACPKKEERILGTMNIRFALVLVVLLLGCENHDLEKNFFKQPLANRVERLRSYPLADQYKIFRYGNDRKEPALMDLADPIAERGATAVPFLVDKLNSESADIAVRDIVLIF